VYLREQKTQIVEKEKNIVGRVDQCKLKRTSLMMQNGLAGLNQNVVNSRISKLVAECYYRRYTRNGDCQCAGTCTGECDVVNTDCDEGTGCYTCEELARMHNGGSEWCNNPSLTDEYADLVAEAWCELSEECQDCCEDEGLCNCDRVIGNEEKLNPLRADEEK